MITFYIILYIGGVLLSLRDKELIANTASQLTDRWIVICFCMINIPLMLTMYQIWKSYQEYQYYIRSKIAIWKIKRLLRKWGKRDGVDYLDDLGI